MSGTLYVVATPIGNLEDITLRALRVLREVALIAAEDTRRTGKLLAFHGIRTPTLSFHAHNFRARIPQLLSRLGKGDSVAVVSDAGTPGISDPGAELVQACVKSGVPVDPVPGASALLAAVMASGFPAAPLTFMGFPPKRASDRKRWLVRMAETPHTVAFFEAPHRIQQTLQELAPLLGDRQIIYGREMTKIHQELARGAAYDLAKQLNVARGEFTVVLGPRNEAPASEADPGTDDAVAAEFVQLTDSGHVTRRAAIAQLARKYGRSSREVYSLVEAAKSRLP